MKVRRLNESDIQRIVKRVLNEQDYTEFNERVNKKFNGAGYEKVDVINLADGRYIGNPDGYLPARKKEGLGTPSNVFLYTKEDKKYTGYALIYPQASRSGIENQIINIKDKQSDFANHAYYFKDVGWKPAEIVTLSMLDFIKGEVMKKMMPAPAPEGTFNGALNFQFGGIKYQLTLKGIKGGTPPIKPDVGKVFTGTNADIIQDTGVKFLFNGKNWEEVISRDSNPMIAFWVDPQNFWGVLKGRGGYKLYILTLRK